jgi:hypothetical protein
MLSHPTIPPGSGLRSSRALIPHPRNSCRQRREKQQRGSTVLITSPEASRPGRSSPPPHSRAHNPRTAAGGEGHKRLSTKPAGHQPCPPQRERWPLSLAALRIPWTRRMGRGARGDRAEMSGGEVRNPRVWPAGAVEYTGGTLDRCRRRRTRLTPSSHTPDRERCSERHRLVRAGRGQTPNPLYY